MSRIETPCWRMWTALNVVLSKSTLVPRPHDSRSSCLCLCVTGCCPPTAAAALTHLLLLLRCRSLGWGWVLSTAATQHESASAFPTCSPLISFLPTCVCRFSSWRDLLHLFHKTIFQCYATSCCFFSSSALSHFRVVTRLLDFGVHHAATPAAADEASAQGKPTNAAATAAAAPAATAAPSAPPTSLPVAAPVAASTDLDLFGGQSALRIVDEHVWQRVSGSLWWWFFI